MTTILVTQVGGVLNRGREAVHIISTSHASSSSRGSCFLIKKNVDLNCLTVA